MIHSTLFFGVFNVQIRSPDTFNDDRFTPCVWPCGSGRFRRVPQAIEALKRSSELISCGVQINVSYIGDDYDASRPEFEYTRLNDIKPQLIAEATANARKSAEQFAQDSGSRLGKIRTAHQGQVIIENRDKGSPQIKKVRVVTTVEYFLQD